jgi:hypothetical protein
MTATKKTAPRNKSKQEPLLNSVARKLGHIAGTLANATHNLSESVPMSMDRVSSTVDETLGSTKKGKSRGKKSTGVKELKKNQSAARSKSKSVGNTRKKALRKKQPSKD